MPSQRAGDTINGLLRVRSEKVTLVTYLLIHSTGYLGANYVLTSPLVQETMWLAAETTSCRQRLMHPGGFIHGIRINLHINLHTDRQNLDTETDSRIESR